MTVNSSAGSYHILARVTRRDQVFGSILAPTHRSPQFASKRGDSEFLPIERYLLAKGASDIRANHRDL